MDRDMLVNLKPAKEFFIAVDSDGCAFPSMELKHKECFIPNTIKYWGLQPISKYAREAAEYVNLYSKLRGENRFPALLKVFDLLLERPEVVRSGVRIPEVPNLRAWVARASSLGNPGLKEEIERNPAPELIRTLQWSEAVNASVEEMVVELPPFPGVHEALEMMFARADIVVVSGTPQEALQREWKEHAIDRYVRAIAGQEQGKKKDHLKQAAKGKYPPERILMIGDAPGDLEAARAVDALFFPVNPGDEEASWERLRQEGLPRFFNVTYAGEYETALIREFDRLLSGTPPWARR